jgi:hypothetical protein
MALGDAGPPYFPPELFLEVFDRFAFAASLPYFSRLPRDRYTYCLLLPLISTTSSNRLPRSIQMISFVFSSSRDVPLVMKLS